MALALYRKYRSRRLDDIVGQSHVTDLLARAIANGRVAHAYLFTGPRGTGKTSIARILAHQINNLKYTDESNHLDIIEIDAASNNGVDDIRDLREKVQLAPTAAKKKVYIIDEVHMLSKPAFNALLKTLEEPPEHVVFILATTDVDKLPDTIISRTQRHTFRRASLDNIMKNLKKIAKKESIKISADALKLIAQHSDGSYRDSVSLLDQLANTTGKDEEITAETIEASLGLATETSITELVEALKSKDFKTTITLLKQLEAEGIQAKVIASQLIMKLTEEAGNTPSLLPLLNDLLTVGQSSLPAAKLLSVLGIHAADDSTSKKSMPVTATATRPVPIPTLEEKATEPSPKDDLVKPKPPARKKELETSGIPIDWTAIVASSKKKSIGLHSVLVKCSVENDTSSLRIYTRNDFYKKKLDMPKYRQELQSILIDQTTKEWDIETIPGLVPPKNTQVAAVAAIMGGGEEVNVESLEK